MKKVDYSGRVAKRGLKGAGNRSMTKRARKEMARGSMGVGITIVGRIGGRDMVTIHIMTKRLLALTSMALTPNLSMTRLVTATTKTKTLASSSSTQRARTITMAPQTSLSSPRTIESSSQEAAKAAIDVPETTMKTVKTRSKKIISSAVAKAHPRRKISKSGAKTSTTATCGVTLPTTTLKTWAAAARARAIQTSTMAHLVVRQGVQRR